MDPSVVGQDLSLHRVPDDDSDSMEEAEKSLQAIKQNQQLLSAISGLRKKKSPKRKLGAIVRRQQRERQRQQQYQEDQDEHNDDNLDDGQQQQQQQQQRQDEEYDMNGEPVLPLHEPSPLPHIGNHRHFHFVNTSSSSSSSSNSGSDDNRDNDNRNRRRSSLWGSGRGKHTDAGKQGIQKMKKVVKLLAIQKQMLRGNMARPSFSSSSSSSKSGSSSSYGTSESSVSSDESSDSDGEFLVDFPTDRQEILREKEKELRKRPETAAVKVETEIDQRRPWRKGPVQQVVAAKPGEGDALLTTSIAEKSDAGSSARDLAMRFRHRKSEKGFDNLGFDFETEELRSQRRSSGRVSVASEETSSVITTMRDAQKAMDGWKGYDDEYGLVDDDNGQRSNGGNRDNTKTNSLTPYKRRISRMDAVHEGEEGGVSGRDGSRTNSRERTTKVGAPATQSGNDHKPTQRGASPKMTGRESTKAQNMENRLMAELGPPTLSTWTSGAKIPMPPIQRNIRKRQASLSGGAMGRRSFDSGPVVLEDIPNVGVDFSEGNPQTAAAATAAAAAVASADNTDSGVSEVKKDSFNDAREQLQSKLKLSNRKRPSGSAKSSLSPPQQRGTTSSSDGSGNGQRDARRASGGQNAPSRPRNNRRATINYALLLNPDLADKKTDGNKKRVSLPRSPLHSLDKLTKTNNKKETVQNELLSIPGITDDDADDKDGKEKDNENQGQAQPVSGSRRTGNTSDGPGSQGQQKTARPSGNERDKASLLRELTKHSVHRELKRRTSTIEHKRRTKSIHTELKKVAHNRSSNTSEPDKPRKDRSHLHSELKNATKLRATKETSKSTSRRQVAPKDRSYLHSELRNATKLRATTQRSRPPSKANDQLSSLHRELIQRRRSQIDDNTKGRDDDGGGGGNDKDGSNDRDNVARRRPSKEDPSMVVNENHDAIDGLDDGNRSHRRRHSHRSHHSHTRSRRRRRSRSHHRGDGDNAKDNDGEEGDDGDRKPPADGRHRRHHRDRDRHRRHRSRSRSEATSRRGDDTDDLEKRKRGHSRSSRHHRHHRRHGSNPHGHSESDADSQRPGDRRDNSDSDSKRRHRRHHHHRHKRGHSRSHRSTGRRESSDRTLSRSSESDSIAFSTNHSGRWSEAASAVGIPLTVSQNPNEDTNGNETTQTTTTTTTTTAKTMASKPKKDKTKTPSDALTPDSKKPSHNGTETTDNDSSNIPDIGGSEDQGQRPANAISHVGETVSIKTGGSNEAKQTGAEEESKTSEQERRPMINAAVAWMGWSGQIENNQQSSEATSNNEASFKKLWNNDDVERKNGDGHSGDDGDIEAGSRQKAKRSEKETLHTKNWALRIQLLVGPGLWAQKWKLLSLLICIGIAIVVTIVLIGVFAARSVDNDDELPAPSMAPSIAPSFVPSAAPSERLLYVESDAITGEASNAFAGSSVSLSADGSLLAIGYKLDRGPGTVRMFRREGMSSWRQTGNTVTGNENGDDFGSAVAVSADGQTVVVGAPRSDDNGVSSGHTQVFRFNTDRSAWEQAGSTIIGPESNSRSGFSVSVSRDGNRIAIGAPRSRSDRGTVQVLSLQGFWSRIGQIIVGRTAGELMGISVSLSDSGETVAIGSLRHAQSGQTSRGRVSVHRFVGSESFGVWEQIGSDMEGSNDRDQLGQSVSLSSDGSRVAAGANGYDGTSGTLRNIGSCQVFVLNETAWTRVGSVIEGTDDQAQLGVSVALSPDGSRLACGAPNSAVNGDRSGLTKVFRQFNNDWEQIGPDLQGQAGSAFGRSVSLSDNGDYLAVGAPELSVGGIANVGDVRIYTN